MSTYVYPRGTDRRPTSTFPVVQRGGIRFFRRVTRSVVGAFEGIGQRGLFIRDTIRAQVGTCGICARSIVKPPPTIAISSPRHSCDSRYVAL